MSAPRTHAGARERQAGARAVSPANGPHEREARRAAEVVAHGGSVGGWSFSAVPASRTAPVQRQDAGGKEKSEDEKKKEALKKAGEAALETPQGKALKEKVLEDPLVKKVADAVTSTPGLIGLGAGLAGGVVALGAAGKELPIQPPEIPLEKLTPKLAGVTAKIAYEGPVNAPTFVGLTITVKEQGPKGKGKPDPIAADIARLKAQDEMFRRGRTLVPGSKEAEQEQLLDEAVKKFVLRGPTLPGLTIPLTPPKPAAKEEEQTPVQPAPAGPSAAPPAHAEVEDALGSGGRPLDPQTRRSMEASFGHDFSSVRIHDDARGAATAARIDAAAFTVGQEIVFGAGRYSPGTAQGRELLAHELAHTIQQRAAQTEAPAVAPGSALEAKAAAAGRAAASGRRVTARLGSSGRAVARQVIGNENLWVPEHLRGEEVEEFQRLWPLVRKGNPYPERGRDLVTFERLKAEANKRRLERAAAVAEAEALLAASDAAEAEEEPKAKPAPAGRPTAARKPPSKFEPGGFTDEDIYRDAEENARRLEYEYGPPQDPRPFEKRFAEAKRKAPMTMLKADFPDSVWRYGRERGLFAPREEALVKETLDAPRREKAAQQTKRDKMRAAQRQQDQFRSFRSGLNLMFIQGALLGGPKAPLPVRLPYAAYGTAHTGVELYHGIRTGSPTRVVGATLPLVTGYTFHRIAAGPGSPPPVRRPGGGGRTALEEVTPDQVRALYRSQPDAVKKNLSDGFHQQVWEQLGGTGPAPLAFRAGRVLQVNEAQWSRVGKLSEINRPEELIGGSTRQADPVGTAKTLPDPHAPTAPGGDPVGTARTLPDPRARTIPDPRARTQVDPHARTVVDPHAHTVPAAEPPAGQQTQPSAPPAPARPPARPRQAMRQAAALTTDEAIAAYGANPGSVHASVSHDWHQQVWNMDRGSGPAPLAFRSGNRILVDVERWPPHLLDRIGRGMRLP